MGFPEPDFFVQDLGFFFHALYYFAVHKALFKYYSVFDSPGSDKSLRWLNHVLCIWLNSDASSAVYLPNIEEKQIRRCSSVMFAPTYLVLLLQGSRRVLAFLAPLMMLLGLPQGKGSMDQLGSARFLTNKMPLISVGQIPWWSSAKNTLNMGIDFGGVAYFCSFDAAVGGCSTGPWWTNLVCDKDDCFAEETLKFIKATKNNLALWVSTSVSNTTDSLPKSANL